MAGLGESTFECLPLSLSVDLLDCLCSLEDEDSFDLAVDVTFTDDDEELCALSLCSVAGLELDLTGMPEPELALELLAGLLLELLLEVGDGPLPLSSAILRFLTAAASSLVAVVVLDEPDELCDFEDLLVSKELTESTRCLLRSFLL